MAPSFGTTEVKREGKDYFHRTHGAVFYMPDGRQVAFAGGHFFSGMIDDASTRKQVESELDKIADVPTSGIFTKKLIPDISEKQMRNDTMRDATAAFDSEHKIAAGVETIPMAGASIPAPVIPGSGHTETGAPQGVNSALEKARAALAAQSHSPAK